jgi:hypothetical protein
MADWTPVAAIGTASGVGLMLIIHMVNYAYRRGTTDNRIAALEQALEKTSDIGALVGALTATMTAMKESIERLDKAVVEINRRTFRGQKESA